MISVDAVTLFTFIIGIAQFFGAIIIGMIVWWLKKIATDLKEITRDLSEFRADVPKTYVLKQDYKDVIDRIFLKLDYLVTEERRENKQYNESNHG